MKKKFYLGVEGGGTKSTAVLADETTVLVERTGSMLNYHSAGEMKVKKNLADLLHPLLRKVGNDKLYAVFGLAGLDTKKDEVVYQRIVRSLLPSNAKFEVVNDSVIAIEAKCPGEANRILVITGTGSNVCGESEGKRATSTGWDFILGDEGSGYLAGNRVLRAAMHSWDGRTRKTSFEKLVLQKSKTKSMEDFIPKFYETIQNKKQDSNSYIASFALLVDQALLQNDWAALQIRAQTAQDLATGVEAVARRLNLQKEKFCVGFTGSLWKMPGLKDIFQKEIAKMFSGASFSESKEKEVMGAILLAKKLNGAVSR